MSVLQELLPEGRAAAIRVQTSWVKRLLTRTVLLAKNRAVEVESLDPHTSQRPCPLTCCSTEQSTAIHPWIRLPDWHRIPKYNWWSKSHDEGSTRAPTQVEGVVTEGFLREVASTRRQDEQELVTQGEESIYGGGNSIWKGLEERKRARGTERSQFGVEVRAWGPAGRKASVGDLSRLLTLMLCGFTRMQRRQSAHDWASSLSPASATPHG